MGLGGGGEGLGAGSAGPEAFLRAQGVRCQSRAATPAAVCPLNIRELGTPSEAGAFAQSTERYNAYLQLLEQRQSEKSITNPMNLFPSTHFFFFFE